jgi:serine/threonine protein kinase
VATDTKWHFALQGQNLGRVIIRIQAARLEFGSLYRTSTRYPPRLERTVAVKAVSLALCASPDLKARLEREARAISKLNHPHICALHDMRSRWRSFLIPMYSSRQVTQRVIRLGSQSSLQWLRNSWW